MGWKIDQIVLENFKYFHQPFALQIHGKNLLVYGENGSGKSSIYWALYTLFQSRHKTYTEAQRYFVATNEDNLRNRYSFALDTSRVKVDFVNVASNPPVAPHSYMVSDTGIDTQNPQDTFFSFTEASSDFLNYKNLTSLTDFRNSQNNDVFPIIEREILAYANFRSGYLDIQTGRKTATLNAESWWKYICNAKNLVPVNKRGNLSKTSSEYVCYEQLLKDFQQELGYYLLIVEQRANLILQQKFGITDLKIVFRPDRKLKTDAKGNLLKFEVNLWAKILNSQMPVGRRGWVNHLKTFFNEAKLTCIGLAIRLSVVDAKVAPNTQGASVLCIDDILISLEMGYRIPVMKEILNYVARGYQLCIFTHDRSFYEMLRKMIAFYQNKHDWVYKEMYANEKSKAHLLEPNPIVLSGEDDEDIIKRYMLNNDYPAAANAMRKLAEHYLHEILPMNLWYKDGKNGIEKKLLSGLFNSSRKNEFLDLYGFTKSNLPNIAQFIVRLMNPLSHDDKDVPIFRKELEDCMTELAKYLPLISSKKMIVRRADIGTEQFSLRISNGGILVEVDFMPIEQWDFFEMADRKYKNCEVKILSVSSFPAQVDSKIKVKLLYERVCSYIHLAQNAPGKEFDVVISRKSDGKKLSQF